VSFVSNFDKNKGWTGDLLVIKIIFEEFRGLLITLFFLFLIIRLRDEIISGEKRTRALEESRE